MSNASTPWINYQLGAPAQFHKADHTYTYINPHHTFVPGIKPIMTETHPATCFPNAGAASKKETKPAGGDTSGNKAAANKNCSKNKKK
ncbi:hypothetical protein EV182_007032 [Spiromyces aspiralis]|uniref:Uncharacterized protein n=1 Tax=Spiromyces aspiralis TaxID=68401 RepID=A0ACC1HLZ9_9FUNG|nr:hypothetical protein EV182_007032 [Spiromyces aspiralis]